MSEQKLISTKEELKTHIHGIHNYMRNNGVGYGFDALNTFNLIYGLKLLEDLIKSGKLDNVLSKDEKKTLLFSKLAKMAEKADDDELYHKIDGEICDILSKHKELKEIFFYEIPKDLRSEVIRNIVLKINAIDTKNNHHLAGKVYEYFIGRDETAISSLGAYFTDRWISKFIIDFFIFN
jgi:type I restriction-modification system DNA methylase subunit